MSDTDGRVPRWSVIVPVHERTDRLDRALDSVPTGGGWVERIVVDDGSSAAGTECIAIVCALAEIVDVSATRSTLEPVTVVRRTHGGAAAARNSGIAAARGEWLVFLDSDDELTPDVFATIRRSIDGTPSAGLVCTAMRQVEPDGSVRTVVPAGHAGLAHLRISATAGSFAVRSDVARCVGGYDEVMTFGENTDLVVRCAAWCLANGADVVATDDVTSVYHASADERRYDEGRWRSTAHLLRRGRIDLTDAGERAKGHAIIAVNATRCRAYATAVRHGAAAVRCQPGNPRHLARLAATLTGPAARRWWLRSRHS